ncbi:MAG: septal ring lytic transglycosylase RlpA family protein [Gallionella sp.]|nr:septal ring lytic transglycosylase RlpA family protein [Gallionella sp.]MDD4957945.1 septal ring lytic transglycosylase RlpA family protein [Gallionella sp.]
MNKQMWLWVSLSVLLAACNTAPPRQTVPRAPIDSRYPSNQPTNGINVISIENIPDAVPRYEPLHPAANNPYVQFNREYRPLQNADGFRQRGIASWYGTGVEGSPTASGELYNDYAMTAAHPILPIPSYARVTSVENGRSVIVRINDRGPFRADRIIHLSYAAAVKLGMPNNRTGEVMVESITPNASSLPLCSGVQGYDNSVPYNNIQPNNGAPIYNNVQPYNRAPVYDYSRPYNGAPIYDNSRTYNNTPYYNDTNSPDVPLFTIQPNSRW